MLHDGIEKPSGLRTRTEGVVCLSKLFARGIVLAFCSYTFEVVSVILEARRNNE